LSTRSLNFAVIAGLISILMKSALILLAIGADTIKGVKHRNPGQPEQIPANINSAAGNSALSSNPAVNLNTGGQALQ
jgi:hypothetical protein